MKYRLNFTNYYTKIHQSNELGWKPSKIHNKHTKQKKLKKPTHFSSVLRFQWKENTKGSITDDDKVEN